MQIELIGCTSAGKSTLTKELLQAAPRERTHHGPVYQHSYDAVLAHFGLGHISPHVLRMAVLNLITLFYALPTYLRRPTLLRLLLRLLRTLPSDIPWSERLKILRITSRNLAIDQIVSALPGTRVILADEGVVQVVHYLFVHLRQRPQFAEIDRYLAQLTLPDLVVYYRQPTPLLSERAERRGHKRIRPHTPENVRTFVNHAQLTFEHLAQSPLLADRLVVIDGTTNQIIRRPQSPLACDATSVLVSLLDRSTLYD